MRNGKRIKGRIEKALSKKTMAARKVGKNLDKKLKWILVLGWTADVAWDHHQAVGREAGQHSGQIDLKPQLIVLWLKVPKFRSKARQGQVQDGVSYSWVDDVGDVFLEMKVLICQITEHILHISHISI